jgi:hypothetical protein
LRHLLRIPSPSKDEISSDVWDLDFIDDGPHVAILPMSERGLAVAFGAGHRELSSCRAGLGATNRLRLGPGGVGPVPMRVAWDIRCGLVYSAALA